MTSFNLVNLLRYFMAVSIVVFIVIYQKQITIPKYTIQSIIETQLPFIDHQENHKIITTDLVLLQNQRSIEFKALGTIEATGLLTQWITSDKKFNITGKGFFSFNQNGTFSYNPINLSPKDSLVINIKDKEFRIKKIEDLSIVFRTELSFSKGEIIANVSLSWWLFIVVIFLFGREIGLGIIYIYRTHLSHRKNYRCALGQLHTNGTCSSITQKAFRDRGLIHGIGTYFKTTKRCKLAYHEINSNTTEFNNHECNCQPESCDSSNQNNRFTCSDFVCLDSSSSCESMECGSC